MAENISSQYTNLFGTRPARNAAPALPGGAADVVPPQPTDRVMLTTAPAAAANVPTATASGDMRNELLALQADLQRINRQVESLISRLDAQQPGPASLPALPPLPPTTAAPTSYNAQAGDYLWKIAKEQLGDANRWPEIYELNKATIGDNPNLLYPGQTLTLPGQAPRPGSTSPGQASWPPAQPTFPPTTNYPPANLPANNLPPLPPSLPPSLPPQNFPPSLPPQNFPPSLPPQNFPPATNFPPQTFPPQNYPPQNAGVADVVINGPSQRQLSDQDAQRLAVEFGLAPANAPLTPQIKANVALFLDEMDSYETSNKGKVFGPGMEALAANQQEVQQIRNSVMQIQQALDILLKSGRLRVNNAQGQPIQQLPASGSFFQLDAQGREVRNAQGAPVMDEAFIAAITQFKQNQGIHQNYRLADGTFGINEYVGPATVEALKKSLTELQAGR